MGCWRLVLLTYLTAFFLIVVFWLAIAIYAARGVPDFSTFDLGKSLRFIVYVFPVFVLLGALSSNRQTSLRDCLALSATNFAVTLVVYLLATRRNSLLLQIEVSGAFAAAVAVGTFVCWLEARGWRLRDRAS